MSSQNIRLSRISHPRSTLAAMLLLIVVFLGFGVVAEACLPEPSADQASQSVKFTDQDLLKRADK